MVYDRLREWQAPPKYQRLKQQQRIARAVNTAAADVQIHATLSSIGVYLDDFTEKAIWQSPVLWMDFDFQRLVAEALMAISSTAYDTRANWRELSAMQDRVESTVGTFVLTMHPRVLSVLLRVLVQNQQTDETQRGAIQAFKKMIWKKAIGSLQPSHPVTLLSALDLAPDRTEDFLEKFTTQLDNKLYDRIDESAPDYVALEKIYTGRALASFGYSGTADKVLESAASLSMADTFTRAEYHRTVGFSQFQRNTPAMTDAAIENLKLALSGYERAGTGDSVEAMYVNYNLGSAFERQQECHSCVKHLEAALKIWESNSSNNQRHGGIKYVLDLHQAYERVGSIKGMQELRTRYASYFEESPDVESG